jgi:acyl-CoA synthetase (AMP-forming)/AMP-acid ligase II
MLIISMIEMKEKIAYTGTGDIVGKPLEGVSAHVSKEDELLIQGPQMYVRYLGDSKQASFFHSGDLGAVDKDGTIILHGRKKDMIIKKGYNIYPGLFEGTISSVPGIRACAMVGIYNAQTEDEEIALFVAKDPSSDLSSNTLRSMLAQGPYSIDKAALPDKIIFIDTLPYSGRSKKVDKQKLQGMIKKYYL